MEKQSSPALANQEETPAEERIASRRADVVHRRLTTLEDTIAEELSSMILRGDFHPGERLNQIKLAEMFSVSRIPVRAALRSLESQGLVTISRRTGAAVAKLDRDQSVSLYLVRDHVETWLVARASLVASEDHTRRLSRLLREMEDVAKSGLAGRWVELDREFHISSYEPVLTPIVEQVVRMLWNSSQAIRRAYIVLPGSLDRALADHRALYEAYVRRDSLRVMQMGSEHIRRTICKMMVGASEAFQSVDEMEISSTLASGAVQGRFSDQANGKEGV